MDEWIAKPRVFLSHSKDDVEFVRQVEASLRRAQIDPWIDELEIRHGRSWLDSIFSEGIASCDCVLVYLTRSALTSNVVRKEIDAGLLENLAEESVAFLPYVSDAALRPDLRPDIRARQAPEWTSTNYQELLPSVVAEVWRSYSERMVRRAMQGEKVRRLETELELSRARERQQAGPFSAGEDRDFEFIRSSFDKPGALVITESGESEDDPKLHHDIRINVGSLVPFLPANSRHQYALWGLDNLIVSHLMPDLEKSRCGVELKFDPTDELHMFGLIRRIDLPPTSGGQRDVLSMLGALRQKTVFTEKMERYRYWLAFNGRMPEKVLRFGEDKAA